ncbi:MAG: hypothetical protein KIH62_002955 [Candidatus Kerfeldbacteria bacterium]|nr:hypothetical protein [Candidatus Kerfeldbacteria bacterium]
MSDTSVVQQIADRILTTSLPYPLRVGINGVDGSGKTVFAKQLVEALQARTERQIITASIDNFHNPKAVRYQKGRDSAEGFYEDSFQYGALKRILLDPLGVNGNRRYATATFDLQNDRAVEQKETAATDNAILILEGIFIFRPELVGSFDLKIYIDVPFKETLHRMLARDTQSTDEHAEATKRFHTRYKAGQELYINTVHPKEISDIVIDNTDFNNPKIINGM